MDIHATSQIKIRYKRRLMFLVALLFVCQMGAFTFDMPFFTPPDNQTVTIDSTNLPIVWIEVGGKSIKRTIRITAHMKIIHNGNGNLNYADTLSHPNQHIDYEGYVAIRYRGNTSYSSSPKKPYSFRPLDKPLEQNGTKQKVNILGMGKDNDWALLAPYFDKSLLRNPLAFEISRPWMEFVPKCQFCEVYLDGIYYGVYIMTEVVSKGKHRTNLDDPGNSGDELTGGYIMEVDRTDEVTYTSKYNPVDTNGIPYETKHINFQYKSPDYEDLTEDQISYINNQIDQMEDALASENYRDPETGYRKYIDETNFIDYQLAMEIGHNVDAYRLSGKFFKRRDSKDERFKMVVWDMDLAYGNANYYRGWRRNDWIYQSNNRISSDKYLIPFWWYKLNRDPDYKTHLKKRWAQYRQGNLSDERLMATVDSLAHVLTSVGAIDRNSQAWPRWGVYVWPNYFIANSFEEEIGFLKQWLTERIEWMDAQLNYTPTPPPVYEKGDVNGDGQVNITDINILIDIIMGGTYDKETMLRADVNEDSEINISDIMATLDIILRSVS